MQWCCQIFFTDCIFTGRWHSAVYLVSEQPEPAPLNSIERIYRGDIDTIVAKALEKDKERRYMSAAELAADIRRYLADEPIVARPPERNLPDEEICARNRGLVAGVGAVVLVLGALKASEVTSDLVARYVDDRRQQKAANATINRVSSLGSIGWLRWPVSAGRSAGTGFLEEGQFEKIIGYCAEIWFRAIMDVGRTYGWRIGELLRLRVRASGLACKGDSA